MATIRPFIVFENGTYTVDNDTAAWLSERTKPMAVFACVGKFRTGKSLLLNRLVRHAAGKGFGVGETVMACTRGIWLSTQFIENEHGPDILVLDTEGIEALDVENDHDVRIFALAILLSTIIAYNSMSHLDEAAVQTLGLTTRIAETLSGNTASTQGDVQTHETTRESPDSPRKTKQQRPTLYWLLRDFSLQLLDANGHTMSHSDYLEQALTPPNSASAKCATRDAIKTLFPTRHLVTLPKPYKGDSAQKLDLKGAAGLTVKFEKFLDTFREHLCTNARPVCAAGAPIGGAAYVALARDLVSKINDGTSIPKIEDSWTLLASVQHQEVFGRMRTALLEYALTLTNDEKSMQTLLLRRWIELHSIERFVPPYPTNHNDKCYTIVTEAIEKARSDGRLKDIAEEEATNACKRFTENGFIQPSLLLLPSSSHQDDSSSPDKKQQAEEFEGKFARHVLQKVVHDILPAFRDHARELGRDETTLELGRMRAEVEDWKKEAVTLKERLLDVQVSAPSLPLTSREDACTSTDDLLANKDIKAILSIQECVSGPRHTSSMDEGHENETKDSETTDAEAARMIVELETCLTSADTRAEEATRKCEDGIKREAAMRDAFERSMEALADDTARKVRAAHSEVEALRKERDASRSTARACEEQASALRDECEKLRAFAREAQEKTVESHKSTLEELRRREHETHGVLDAHRKEHADLRVRTEASATENRALKRRMEELLETVEDAKRLRVTLHESEVQVARVESERDALRAQIQGLRAEHEGLRTAKVELETRLAVSEATAKLESCKRSV